MRRANIGQLGDPALVQSITSALCGQEAFQRVDVEPLGKLVRLGILIELDPGEALIRQGEASVPELYVLVEGTLVVRSDLGFIARLEQPGTVVGEVAVLMATERSADVIAESPVRALAIPSDLGTSPEAVEVAPVVRLIMSDSLGAKLRDDWVKYEDFVKF